MESFASHSTRCTRTPALRLAAAVLGLGILGGACGCSPVPGADASDETAELQPKANEAVANVTPVTNGHLWILNRTGNRGLTDYFNCLFSNTSWNQLASAYYYPLLLTLGKEVFVSGSACNPSGADDQAAFQCAVDAGRFDVKPYDLVLIIRNDGRAGGHNDSAGGVSVRNPVSGATVRIDTAEVGNGTAYGTWDYLYLYASHEVFEAQTDGVSADCCDGETAWGGSFPWCSECGPPSGACGVHQRDLGIAHVTCPSGVTYPYQTVSPPGGYYYGSPEFNGTCQTVRMVSAWNCANSAYHGNQYWTCGNGNLNKCDANGRPMQIFCGRAGCKVNPVGTDDQCYGTVRASAERRPAQQSR